MKVRTKKEKELLTDNQKHFKEKQDPRLQFRTFSYHRNERIGLHYRSDTLTRERTNNIHVKDHELNGTKLQNLEKRNIDHHLNDQEMKEIPRRNTKRSQDYYRL